jgi:hypothetical protein
MDLQSINTKEMEATACGLRVRLRLRTSDEARRGGRDEQVAMEKTAARCGGREELPAIGNSRGGPWR